jgi:hypothetical protein
MWPCMEIVWKRGMGPVNEGHQMRCFSPSQWILRAVRSVLTRLSVMVLPKECVFSKSGGNLMGDLITVHTELKKTRSYMLGTHTFVLRPLISSKDQRRQLQYGPYGHVFTHLSRWTGWRKREDREPDNRSTSLEYRGDLIVQNNSF